MIELKKSAVTLCDYNELILQMIPESGVMEVHKCSAGASRSWHHLHVDQKIIIIEGEVRFFWAGNECVCTKGDVLLVKKYARYGYKVQNNGTIYGVIYN